jgi:GTP pyrophosphokinase
MDDAHPSDQFAAYPEDIIRVVETLCAQREDVGTDRILAAYDWAARAHDQQFRQSGEPYITHPVAVAQIVADMRMDDDTIIATLLHDVLEDSRLFTADDIRREFGEDVLHLVQGVTKLQADEKVGDAQQRAAAKSRRSTETMRKMMLAMAKDYRVMVIKLSDRLHNMRTLDLVGQEKRVRVASETLEVYAPLAARLGIWQIKWQLEDLSFKALHPREFQEISDLVGGTRAQRETILAEDIALLRSALEAEGVKVVEIRGRPKHLFSIFNKMVQQKLKFEEIYDLLALRIITETKNDCYVAIGVVNDLFVPIQAMYFDYIGQPKANGYQSLHTKIVDKGGHTVEIQIRTREMHETAEYGFAAHWTYKEGSTAGDEAKRLARLRAQLLEAAADNVTPSDYKKAMTTDLFEEQVFAITPKGDVIELPEGSTPIDFAFRVHTQLGLTLIGAKINGVMLPLSSQLKNGDVVELITRSNATPSRDWVEQAKSAHTRNKLKNYFRKLDKDQDALRGREILEREFSRIGLDPKQFLGDEKLKEAMSRFEGIETPTDVLARVGAGLVSVQNAIAKLRGITQELAVPGIEVRGTRETQLEVQAGDFSGVQVSRAKCCSPIPGDECAAYISRGRGLIVHRRVCPNLAASLNTEPDRVMAYAFNPDGKVYASALKIMCIDRAGLIADISHIFGEAKTNVSALKVVTIVQQTAEIDVTIDVRDAEHLEAIQVKLHNLSDVISVRRQFAKTGK